MVNRAHHSLINDIQIDKTSLSALSPSNEISDKYSSLIETLENKPFYAPVFVQDFAPKDRFERRQWLRDLVVPFDAMLYTYTHGNSFGSLNFIWQVESEIDQTRNSQTLTQLSSKLCHTFVQTDYDIYFSLCIGAEQVVNEKH